MQRYELEENDGGVRFVKANAGGVYIAREVDERIAELESQVAKLKRSNDRLRNKIERLNRTL